MASDEEADGAAQLLPATYHPQPRRPRPRYNRTQVAMWRTIAVLAFLSFAVLVVFAPQDHTAARQNAEKTEILRQHNKLPGQIQTQTQQEQEQDRPDCRNSTLHQGCLFDTAESKEHEHYSPADP